MMDRAPHRQRPVLASHLRPVSESVVTVNRLMGDSRIRNFRSRIAIEKTPYRE
jgi:hypothetical protein